WQDGLHRDALTRIPARMRGLRSLQSSLCSPTAPSALSNAKIVSKKIGSRDRPLHAVSNVPGLCGFVCPCEPLVCGFSSPPHAFSQRPAPCPPHWRTDPASRSLPTSPWAPGQAAVRDASTVPGGVWSDGCVVFVSPGKLRQALNTFLTRREPPPRKRRGPVFYLLFIRQSPDG